MDTERLKSLEIALELARLWEEAPDAEKLVEQAETILGFLQGNCDDNNKE